MSPVRNSRFPTYIQHGDGAGDMAVDGHDLAKKICATRITLCSINQAQQYWLSVSAKDELL